MYFARVCARFALPLLLAEAMWSNSAWSAYSAPVLVNVEDRLGNIVTTDNTSQIYVTLSDDEAHPQ